MSISLLFTSHIVQIKHLYVCGEDIPTDNFTSHIVQIKLRKA